MNNPTKAKPSSVGLQAAGLVCLNPQTDGRPAGLQGERQRSSDGQFISDPAA